MRTLQVCELLQWLLVGAGRGKLPGTGSSGRGSCFVFTRS